MTDLKPWIDDGAPVGVRELLAAARAEEPSRGGAERALVALGVGSATVAATTHAAAGTAIAAASTTSGAVTAGGVAFAVKWGLVGALGAVTTFGVAHVAGVVLGPDRQAASTSALAVPPGSPAPVGAARAQSPGAAITPPGVPLAAPPTAGSPTEPWAAKAAPAALPSDAPTPPLSRSTGAPGSPSAAPFMEMPGLPETAESRRMLEEVSAVDRARALLGRGDSRGAIGAIDAYAARFPEQRFAPEALYLRMEALSQAGDGAGARAAASRLLQLFPSAPQAARARAVLGAVR